MATATLHRIGDEIFMKGMMIRMIVDMPLSQTDVTYRLLLVKCAKGDTSTTANVFSGLSTCQLIDTMNIERFNILSPKVFQTKAGNMSVANATGAYTLDTQDVGCISSGIGYGRQLRPLHGRTGVSQLHTMHPRPSKPLLPSSLLLFLLTDQRCLLGCPHYTT
jgi:hypothetical protein